MTDEKMITITLKEYNRLKDQVSWLECLEDAGVDNWQGIEDAVDIHRERFGFGDHRERFGFGEDEDDE